MAGRYCFTMLLTMNRGCATLKPEAKQHDRKGGICHMMNMYNRKKNIGFEYLGFVF